MSKIKQKLTEIVIITILLIMIPIIALATNEKIQIVQTEENEYIIYVENMEETEYKYAISNNKNATDIDLHYINSEQDELGNFVILIDSTTYESIKDDKVYLWIKEGENQVISAEEIDFSKAFSKDKMAEVENTTKRISTEIVSDIEEEDRVDENGIHYTVKVGGIRIKDKEKATYSYQIKPATGDYKTLMDMAGEINSNYDSMSMYEKIQITNQFYDLYENLINQANWQELQEMTIKQPKDAEENSEYVVFIKKVDGENITLDAQFMTCTRKENPEFEREKIVTQETAKLPITGESIILIAIFAVVVLALIIVFVRMKKLKEQNGK